MNNQQHNNPKVGKWMLPAALAPLICCGGIFLLPLIGTGLFATLTGFLLHPLVQLIGVVILVIGFSMLWRRIKRKTHGTKIEIQRVTNDATRSFTQAKPK